MICTVIYRSICLSRTSHTESALYTPFLLQWTISPLCLSPSLPLFPMLGNKGIIETDLVSTPATQRQGQVQQA